LVSVVLIAGVALSVIRLHQQNRHMVLYLVERNQAELSNTLFLDRGIAQQDSDTVDADTMVTERFQGIDQESRAILQSQSRTVNLSDPLAVNADQNLSITMQKILLKGTFSAHYFMLQ
jgi:hypothetical protein